MGRRRKIEKYGIEDYVNMLLDKRMTYHYISEMIKLKYGHNVSHQSIFRWANNRGDDYGSTN